MSEHLDRILERKRREILRRARRTPRPLTREPMDLDALRRSPGARPHVIAEIKHASPSGGVLRARTSGGVAAIARAYEANGASAVSVLCDGPGFGGTPLDVRRVSRAIRLPVLFKEFVLDPLQLDLAVATGASMVLLLVRALDGITLDALVGAAHARGLVPVVEAADAPELETALATDAAVVGVNARDLQSFRIDTARAADLVENVPQGRIAVYMSGVETRDDLDRVARGRADAVLIGTWLMRAPDPGAALAHLTGRA
jgi:indole-3-glycerol phosphate synthase